MLSLRDLTKKKVGKFISTYRLPLFLLLTMCGFSLLAAQNKEASVYGIAKLTEFLLFFLATSAVIQREKKRFLQLLPIVVLGGVFFVSVLAIVQFSLQRSVGGPLYFFGERTFTSETPGIANASLNGALVLRPYATFPHPNLLAAYLLVGQVILAAWLLSLFGPASHRMRTLLLLCAGVTLLVSTAALFLTLSRVVLFLWFVGVVSFTLIFLRKRSTIYVLVCGVILLVIASPFLLPFLLPRFQAVSLGEQAVTDRVRLAHSALAMIGSYPVTGVGLNNFLVRLSEFSLSKFLPLQPVHNIFLLAFSELGILGFSFLVGAFCMALQKTQRVAGDIARITLSYLFLCLLVFGMTDHYLTTLQQGQLITTLFFAVLFSAFHERGKPLPY